MKKPVNFSIQFPATRSTISEKIRGAGASHEFWRPCKVFRRQDEQLSLSPPSPAPRPCLYATTSATLIISSR